VNFLENIDRELLLFLNGLNADWLDPIMKIISSFWVWYPIIILFIFLSVKIYKSKFWIPILCGVICFAITDQVSFHTKENVQRYRPSHNVEIAEQVHIVDNYRGGIHGFFSGHAANSFGLAFISLLFVKKRYYTIIALVWASIVSYSRIYLGVHYPSDIFVGALFGTGVAFLIYYIHNKIYCCRIK
jgi:undecaprenyl-diphosphatase